MENVLNKSGSNNNNGTSAALHQKARGVRRAMK